MAMGQWLGQLGLELSASICHTAYQMKQTRSVARQHREEGGMTRGGIRRSKPVVRSVGAVFCLALAVLPAARSAVEELVRAGAHLSEPGSLPDAAACGETERAEHLLAQGMPPNASVEDGLTALHCAGGTRRVALARRLLDAGADPNASNHNGFSVMHAAANRGDAELIRLLAEAGARVGQSADSGFTPLHCAVWKGRTDAVRALLEAGADAAATGLRSGTPLHLAANFGHVGIAEQLLAAGADPNAAEPSGRTPLHKAAATGHAEVARLLVDAGAEPLADKRGDTPLHVAAWSIPCPGILEALRQAGVDVDAQNEDGATALHMAAGLARRDDAEWLLEHGVRTDLKDKTGRTPHDWAAREGHEDIQALLRKHAAGE